mgnify:CR=1 FL=1
MKGQRKAERGERIREMAKKVGKAGAAILKQKTGIDFGDLDAIADEIPYEIDEPVFDDLSDEKGYLLGKVPFEPWKMKWWKSKRVPMMQKILVAAAVGVTVDAITGGHVVLQRVGLMKPKKKKK